MTTSTRILTEEQIDHFIRKGYVLLKEAMPREQALAAREFLWGKLAERAGVLRDDRTTWTQPMVNMRETFRNEAFDRCNSARFADAIEELVGSGRVLERHVWGEGERLPGWGWWPVNFSYGDDEEWTVPKAGWHWDGIQFRHYVDAPDQGLLCLCLFSDIGPRGGGTLVVEGSHRPVARFLARWPEGIELKDAVPAFMSEHPYFTQLTGRNQREETAKQRVESFMNRSYVDADGTELRVVETTGEAGDVILCHPFLIHAASPNHSGIPRFMCNRTSPLKEKFRIAAAGAADESPLERSVRLALS